MAIFSLLWINTALEFADGAWTVSGMLLRQSNKPQGGWVVHSGIPAFYSLRGQPVVDSKQLQAMALSPSEAESFNRQDQAVNVFMQGVEQQDPGPINEDIQDARSTYHPINEQLNAEAPSNQLHAVSLMSDEYASTDSLCTSESGPAQTEMPYVLAIGIGGPLMLLGGGVMTRMIRRHRSRQKISKAFSLDQSALPNRFDKTLLKSTAGMDSYSDSSDDEMDDDNVDEDGFMGSSGNGSFEGDSIDCNDKYEMGTDSTLWVEQSDFV